MNNFRINRNYLIRVRIPGKSREDFIGTFTGIGAVSTLHFRILYTRNARRDDNDSYNPWTRVHPRDSIFPLIHNREVRFFDLGRKSHLITSTRSPDEVKSYLDSISLTLNRTPVHPVKNKILSYIGGKTSKNRKIKNRKTSKNKK